MKKGIIYFLIQVIFLLLLLPVYGQTQMGPVFLSSKSALEQYKGTKVNAAAIDEKLMLVFDNVEKLLQPNRADSLSRLALEGIRKTIIDTRRKLKGNLLYPQLYGAVFDHYNTLLVEGDRAPDVSKLQDALHYIAKDLALKSGQSDSDTSTGAITLVNVHVKVIENRSETELSGFRVRFTPFLNSGNGAATIELNQATRQATGLVPPGWYKIIVTNAQGQRGEKEFTLEWANRSGFFPIEVRIN